MQQIPAWARRKSVLLAAAATILGMALLIWSFAAGQAAPAPTSGGATALEETDDGFGALIADGDQAPEQAPGPEATPAAEFVIVYISGAVRRPDVYQLPVAARVKDVVLAAGGLADDADPDQINLADHIADAQHIYVPRLGEPPAVPSSGDGAPTTGEEMLIDINTASVAELEGLPGIGQSFAERIVEYRTANGPFQAVDDLQNVKGIGPALFDKIAPLVTVGP